MIELINKADVTNTYSGAEGCACGCLGTYAKTGATVTRRVNEINKVLSAGQYVATYAYSDKVVYEYAKTNGRVVRVYVANN